jgi:hypothetical protein
MFKPLLHGSVSQINSLDRAGWIVLLILVGVTLAWFDTWSARREQPRVTVPDAPDAEPRNPGLKERRMLTEKLQFCLPAVDVSRPAVMPGSTTIESVASLAAESGVRGSGVAAALIRTLQSLQGQPSTYQVRMFIEPCELDRYSWSTGGKRRVTVEVRDARTGRSIGVKVLQSCRRDEAAEMVAGYTARKVLWKDPSTPDWAVGSTDGEDLSAYLLARQTMPEGRTYRAWWDCRQARRRKLEQAARHNTGGMGVVGYELADIYDLNGDNMRSVLWHLRNRVRCRQFWRGRLRLAISLGMLAGSIFDSQWMVAAHAHSGQHCPGCMKCDIITEMSNANMLRHKYRTALCADRTNPKKAKLALLRLSRREFHACRWHSRAFVLLWTAFWYRRVRNVSLTALRGKPRWWRHPRRRLWPIIFGLEIVKQRTRQLKHPTGARKARDKTALENAQKRVRRRLRLGEVPCPTPKCAQANNPQVDLDGEVLSAQLKPAAMPTGYSRAGLSRVWWWVLTRKRDRRWDYQRAPWQAVYNAACLHALPDPSDSAADEPLPGSAEIAVRLLQLAISDPACELERPSEWIATDPDLRALQNSPEFVELVRDQAQKDFGPSLPCPDIGDSWFWKQLQEILASSMGVTTLTKQKLSVNSHTAAPRALRKADRIMDAALFAASRRLGRSRHG